MIVPFDGRVKRVVLRSSTSSGLGVTTVGFHKASNGSNVISTTPTTNVTQSFSAQNTSVTFDFPSTATFSAGDIIGFKVTPTNDHGDCNVLVILAYQTSAIVSGSAI
jgi:hypothetical protein